MPSQSSRHTPCAVHDCRFPIFSWIQLLTLLNGTRNVPTTFLVAILFTFAAVARAEDPEPIAPTGVIHPFSEDLAKNFTSWLKKSKAEDPDHVFELKDGVLHCGDGDMGYVATKQPYKDYWLTVEYKWGRKNETDKYVRNSGVLLHGTGPDGSAGGVWMTSLECQLAQGCEGDLIVISGKTADGKGFPATITSNTRKAEDGKTRYDPAGEATKYSGKQFWWSKHQPFFEELNDTRGKDDVASPFEKWTRVDCLCREKTVLIFVNGHAVNGCFDANPAAGKILLQTEGHEVLFRDLRIRPLPKSEAFTIEMTTLRQEKK